jgi:prephenate dehydratase
MQTTVAIQGSLGAFHQQAAEEFFGPTIQVQPYREFSEVFKAVMTQETDYAIVAIENSLYGSINATYDLLLKHKPVIIGEKYLHIQFQLLGIAGATLTEITDVYSQVMGLAQVQTFLDDILPHATRHETHDTAAAAEMVAREQDPHKAAIASAAAAARYNLDILAANIEDDRHNYTRFIVLSSKTNTQLNPNKTSIILTTNHQPGALHAALGVFSQHKLNLTKIESRPIPGPQWHYMFYLDFESNAESEATKACFEELKKLGCEIVVLGSYESSALPT